MTIQIPRRSVSVTPVSTDKTFAVRPATTLPEQVERHEGNAPGATVELNPPETGGVNVVGRPDADLGFAVGQPATQRGSAQLGPAQRTEALERMKRGEVFDVVIIGAGVTGAYAALDAASRGLSVAIIDSQDIAAGTSSRSSSLLHGGYRYQRKGDMGLVREASQERNLAFELAPHLVEAAPFLYPLTGGLKEHLEVGARMTVYDHIGTRLGHKNPLPRHKHLTPSAAHALAPGLKEESVKSGGVLFHEARIDDARYTRAIARTAALHGAALATSVEMTGFVKDGEQVKGVQARDRETGETFEIRGRAVVSATGIWTNEVQEKAGGSPAYEVAPSKGVHEIMKPDAIDASVGLFLQTEKSVQFVNQLADGSWSRGTTDDGYSLEDKEHPTANAQNTRFLREQGLNPYLKEPIEEEQIIGRYAGMRPLIADGTAAAETARTSRKYQVSQPAPGFYVIAGGKLTTARAMGKSVIDEAARRLGTDVAQSRTEKIRLVGAAGFEERVAARDQLAARHGLSVEQVERLLHRYGSEIDLVLELMERNPAARGTLPGAPGVLKAEILFAATHEGALHLNDVLTRCTRVSITTDDRGVEAAEPAARLLAPVLGWDDEQTEREIALYRARVAAELAAEKAPDDDAASAVRLSVPDPRQAASAAATRAT